MTFCKTLWLFFHIQFCYFVASVSSNFYGDMQMNINSLTFTSQSARLMYQLSVTLKKSSFCQILTNDHPAWCHRMQTKRRSLLKASLILLSQCSSERELFTAHLLLGLAELPSEWDWAIVIHADVLTFFFFSF